MQHSRDSFQNALVLSEICFDSDVAEMQNKNCDRQKYAETSSGKQSKQVGFVDGLRMAAISSTPLVGEKDSTFDACMSH